MPSMKIVYSSFLFILVTFITFAQQPKKQSSSEIFESIKKLNFLGSVLYVGAHPDDENTRLISYMSNEVKARTAYLSMTRGDGGQNLIGPEIRELLGVIRTQELLAARRTDGGEQIFTRANDFGFSKSPDETLQIWNKEEVLSDVVLAIRQFQPDIIINRFDHRTAGETHGHHTSSAILSMEAFDLANNPSSFPNQLKRADVWQPKRLFFNTSWWFYGSQDAFEKADKSKLLAFDTGVFFPTTGLSNPEIAALSRTNHKSQGFGSTGSRGEELEYIEILKGDLPSDKNNLFDGIDTSWNRVKGGEPIGKILGEVQAEFDFTKPSASVPKLMKAYALINKLENEHWKEVKLKEIKEIITQSSGIYLEAVSRTQQATNDELIKLDLEAINRSDLDIELVSISETGKPLLVKNSKLENNIVIEMKDSLRIDSNVKPSTPYWLTDKGTLGMYKVSDASLIGKPETPRTFTVDFNLKIEDEPITLQRNILYKTNDPVKGEVYKPFEVIPMASSRFLQEVIIFNDNDQKEIQIAIKSGKDNLEGYVELKQPANWKIFPAQQKFAIEHKGEEQILTFTVIPPQGQDESVLSPIVHVGNRTFEKQLVSIDYDHIPFQTVLLPSETKLVKMAISKRGDNIAYVEGAGDVLPENLRNIGYNVSILKPEEITQSNLERFDAVVMGVRAYNVLETLRYKQNILFEYVKNGGNMIVQYNTSRDTNVDQLAPYELELSRDRVTDENSEVRILAPNHEVLNYPNKITQKDFEGWTQERGLYFPDKWGAEFTPILSMNDKDESPKDGSLLIANYGKGHYIYTGLSFFREFPAGVSGAYRLFANMLSLGKNEISSQKQIED
ncbi:GlcNAc-PI de-N-acetylase [Flavobacteriaceae bacterium MAR_2010_188]|nr:GlcNAc-PI de-N-acetylase [Flavobacteriaceae bacterium MAR_2010_188]